MKLGLFVSLFLGTIMGLHAQSYTVDWSQAPVQNNTNTQTFNNINNSGVDMTVTLSHVMQQVNQPVQPPFQGYINGGHVLRIWKTSSPSVVTVTISFSEPIELEEFGFGGIRKYSANEDQGTFTWYDGPSGTGNVVQPSDPNSTDVVNFDILENLDPSITCTEMDGSVEGGSTGDGNITYNAGTYQIRGITQSCGTDCGKVYYIFNYHKAQVQSMVWQATRVPSGTPSQYLGGINFSKISLPLDLLSIDAKADHSGNLLEWTTSNEIGVEGFYIEKSNADEASFEQIDFVPATGSTSNSRSYDFMDYAATSGTTYYRLKMMDLDGRYEYSPVVQVENNKLKTTIKAWPNPTTDVINIQSPTELISVELYDFMGRKLLSGTSQNNRGLLDVRNFYPGAYLLKVVTQDEEVTQRILIAR